MYRKIIITALVLTFALSNYGFSATRTYQKVTRKAVEILPKTTTTKTPYLTQDIKTNTAPAKPPTKEEPKKEVIQEVADVKDPIPAQPVVVKSVRDPLPDFQLGLRIGAIAPAFGIIADATVLPVVLSDTTALFTRISVGTAQDGSTSSTVAYITELVRFKKSKDPMAFYAGAGINLPFASGANAGYNIVLGVERSISFLDMKNEAVFLETGLNSFKAKNVEKSMLNFLGGYKFSF
ncbi:MAG: hypothetical protein DKM50_02125 [Candidatus Margulisiibacteriota bacterium]|nr:MAG: hypothetical protein A2X43_06585 [Candidatus Margulisbacteria bacterium GWD2_39_127]OGI05314.1 MAG: hypothetical protein A2X42_03900 [Candidatus Margulisbacteria bacterium GWF2_38_17]OGI10827.1 MAG: hypothetical protein A2X41_05575 [Candidatus Margulisbacteria bacterium GWE2_39_32]PZM83513.1 MAG: hypothetical protein DKM50_02125 [Candidatus Margulisiibacteriota bacterium]HAR64310.1 hypothetical protein [Candidatus Margulisiibacteriota bacterium]